MDPCDLARQSYLAFAESDREALERLIADDFRFTSPLDNGLDRATFFERCWPNTERITAFEFVRVVRDGDHVFVTYEGSTDSSKFRNVEVLTIRDGKIHAVEVYFGWNLPHPAPPGGFVQETP